MANLLVEEPYALMRARTGLWEPWVGNYPGPPCRAVLKLRPYLNLGVVEPEKEGFRHSSGRPPLGAEVGAFSCTNGKC